MSKKLVVIWILFGLFLVAPKAVRAQVQIERSTEIITISNKQYYMHHVKHGETLYSLARTYQVTEEEIRRLNPEINELGPSETEHGADRPDNKGKIFLA